MSEKALGQDQENPTVSVLVPIYNVEAYLGQCLGSLVAQTFRDFEAICVNDGSTDGSRAIIQDFMDQDPRFRVIDKANSGYGASMNRGLAEARGAYVAILESDDFFEPDALEALVRAIKAGDAQVAKAAFWLYWSRPAPRRSYFPVVDLGWDGRTLCPREEAPEVFYRKPSIWSALYRRDFLEAEGIRFLETPGASYQDAGFNYKVWLCADRAAFTTRAILNYRQDNEASSVNSSQKAYCVVDEYREMQRFLDAHPQVPPSMQGVLERMKYDSYMWNYARLSKDLRPSFVEAARQELSADLAAGKLDESRFDLVRRQELGLLLNDPARFERSRESLDAEGNALTWRHYLDLGGPLLVARLAAGRLARRLGLGGGGRRP